jgi:OmpA-OmpF porin, OOP family
MKLRSALVAAGLVALPAAAMAQPVDGLYIGAGIGYNYAGDQNVNNITARGGGRSINNTNLSTNGGVIGLGSVGYGFGNGFRLELQGDYRNYHQNFNYTTPSGNTTFTSRQSFLNQTYGGFVNGLYDFDIGAGYVFPYAGVGFGYEETSASNSVRSNSAGSAAGQVILGAAFPIPDVPGLSMTAEFRFMATFENETFHGSSNSDNSLTVGSQLNYAGLVGLRYAFGVEAPPPPPAPAPAPVAAPMPPPARTYLVFFDWDKADLSARARQIIGEAAQNVGKVQVTRIEVNGYADLTGSHAYNLKLSQRRADAVAAELVKDGVPKGEIFTQAFGDTHPLVPTAEGVREPQNRRVEIILK